MNTLRQLEESSKNSLPEHFQRLVETILAERSNFLEKDKTVLEIFSLENDYILCVLVTVAVECGFRLDRSNTTNLDIRISKAIEYKPKWRDSSRRLYSIDLYLADLKNARFVLLLVPILGHAALINFLSMKKDVVTRSSVESLLPSHWLSLFRPSIPERFDNLPVLARKVRKFLQREKDIALNSANKPNPSLLGLPDEIKLQIFKLISAKDFVQLTGTCKSMQFYKRDPTIWKHHLKKDFNLEADDPFDYYVGRYCTSKVVAPAFPDFGYDFFPLMRHRTTSSTTLDTVINHV